MGDNLLIEPENLDNSVTSDDQNLDAYDDLIISIQSAENILNILICVCDQDSLREKIIQQYEEELGDNFLKYQIKLGEEKLSLTAELEQLVQQHSELKTAKQAVITVTGISSLLGLSFNEEKSPLDTFFGYLQWTREALRQFPYSIVLWINKSMETKLPKNAPDFWSWRKGVFRFVSPIKSYVARDKFKDSLTIFNQPQLLNFDNQESSLIPLHDLQALIKHLESNPQPQDELKLATLYSSLGKVYLNRIKTEGSANYAQELDLAIKYYQKAKDLQQKLNLELNLAESLHNLAKLYYYQGKYKKAEPLFLQALTMKKKLLGDEHHDVANSLHNLAKIYYTQGNL
jgi:tetratricopeptide (TPR) repeat protein